MQYILTSFILLFTTFFTTLFHTAHGAYLVKQTKQSNQLKIESVTKVDIQTLNIKKLKSIQEFIAESDKTEAVTYEEILYPEKKLPDNYFSYISNVQKNNLIPMTEVKSIVKQGPDKNRIVITILGDGYTNQEKQKYFDDVNRMVDHLFKEVTFKSYLPLFNIYAVFMPSIESGISDIVKRDTAFGLYRSPPNSKRAIIPGKRAEIEKALNLVSSHTDYPIIIANDSYYGGLGGRYAITTSSLTSGAMVLRHELGHNFSNVGEEYDGGQVYSGANFSSSKNVPWKHWVRGEVSVNEAKFLTGAYLWQDLGQKDYIENFAFPFQKDHTFDLNISSVGWSTHEDVKVYLDGKELELDGVFTRDRSFFQTKKVALLLGEHRIQIEDHNHDGDNVLAFANGYAYPASYDFSDGKIGAFNVFDSSGKQRGYRPTHNQCLMRDMRSKTFCPVDQENIWMRFLDRVSLIDEVVEENGIYQVRTLKLDGLSIKWYKKSVFSKKELTQFSNKKEANLRALGPGTYEVKVSFSTPEIRKITSVTSDSLEIKIK